MIFDAVTLGIVLGLLVAALVLEIVFLINLIWTVYKKE